MADYFSTMLAKYLVENDGKIMKTVEDAVAGNILISDETGQAVDSGKSLADGEVYGVRRDLSSSSSTWERIGESIGKTANATHDGSAVTNDFDSIYPWSDIKTVNLADDGTINAEIGNVDFKFDGSNGEVMTYIPPFYYSRYRKDGYEYILISKNYFGGAVKSEGFYVGRYTTSSGVHSKSGVASQVSTNITDFRTQATGKGTGWQQLDYHYLILLLLYFVEYADYNMQTKVGFGNVSTSAQINSGGCDDLGMKSGCLANDKAHAVIYRGIENLWGNIWQFMDGVNIKDNQVYINYNPSTYVVDTFTDDYKALSYVCANANGWQKSTGYDSENPLVGFPTAVGGGDNTYMCDYYSQNSGNRIALVGGAWSDDLACGAYFSIYVDSSVSYTYIGARLLKI